ncbi:MAG: DNA-binding response regulator [Azospira oryzae]|jgi:two-component system LytT family response regulator|nr:MAG: DNA-binding response regulator [Azospira oryzae]
MTQLTCIAVDDEAKALEVIKSHLHKVPFLQPQGFFTDALAAITFIQQHPVDVLFLDIQMPDITGTQFARLIGDKAQVIFTTAYSDYAVEGFELRALDYLVKPIPFGRFFISCQRALEKMNKEESALTYTYIKDGFDWIRIEMNDILFLKSDGNYIEFHLADRKVISRMTMKEVLELLPAALFQQVHRSYIVSKSKIQRITRDEILINKQVIPIGSNFMNVVDTLISK